MSEVLAAKELVEKLKKRKEEQTEELIKIEQEISEKFTNALKNLLIRDLSTIVDEEKELLEEHKGAIERYILRLLQTLKKEEKLLKQHEKKIEEVLSMNRFREKRMKIGLIIAVGMFMLMIGIALGGGIQEEMLLKNYHLVPKSWARGMTEDGSMYYIEQE